jgi:hypothetical protein
MSKSATRAAAPGWQPQRARLALVGALLMSISSPAYANRASAILAVHVSVVDSCQIVAPPIAIRDGRVEDANAASPSPAFGLHCRQAPRPVTQVGDSAPQFGAVDAQELGAIARRAGLNGRPVVVSLYF